MGGEAENPVLKPHQSQISSSNNRRRSGGGHFQFPVGSLVEVRTDEEDFRGVYFSATVIEPSQNSPKKGSKKKSRKLYVEYHNLLAHEDGSDRLREHVDVSFVRPAPPLQEIVKGFEPDDIVDAFYKDGWWTGVVSRVVEGGEKFVVTFQNPPDLLEFGLSELRPHWDWVNGSWVRPQKQSITGLMFEVGRKVEVSFDREDFQDAWFPATIHEDLGNGVFLVEYNSANMDYNGEATKATVDSLHVRPCPPLLKDKNFVLLEKVDAFFDFGWWSGVITKQLENSRYNVFFKQMKQDKEFSQSELRPHMEWKDGKWFTSSQEASIPSSDDGVHEHNTSENSSASAATAPTAPVKSSVDTEDTRDGITSSSLKGHFEQLTPDYQKMSQVTTSLTKRRQYLSDLGTALSQPLKKQKEGNIVGANQQDRHDRPIKEVLCGCVSPDSVNNMETSATETTGDQSSCNPSWEDKVWRKQRNIRAKQFLKRKIKSTSSSVKRSSTRILPLESVDGGKEPDAAGNTEEDAQNEHAKEGSELPIIIGLPCSESGKRSHHSNSKDTVNDQEQPLNNSAIQKIKDSTQSAIGESTEKRKRGRPRKILVDAQTPVAGVLNRKDGGVQKSPEVVVMETDVLMSDKEKMTFNKEKQANGQSDPKSTKLRMSKRTLSRVHEEKEGKQPFWLGENRSSKRGRMGSGRISVQVKDSIDASGGKKTEVDHTVEVERGAEVPSNEFDNRPLSKWIEEMQSPPIADGSRPSSSEGILKECAPNGEKQRDGSDKQPESGKQASASIDEGSIGQRELQSLSTVENTVGVELDKDSEKQPESGKQASDSVDKSSKVPSEPQSFPPLENTDGVLQDEDSKKQPENGTQASALVDKGSIVPSDPSLPFVKNTSLWKTIESMEVFQKLPQKPHFQPLEQFKASTREGLAIGYMVTFASLVEKASKLHFNDPQSIMDDITETLVDLEQHGFDVRVVQDHVNKLLEVKDKEGKLVHEVGDLNNKLSEHNLAKTRYEEEIREFKEHMRELQEKLSLAESEKEKEDDEIAFLQARLRVAEESIKNMRTEASASSIL